MAPRAELSIWTAATANTSDATDINRARKPFFSQDVLPVADASVAHNDDDFDFAEIDNEFESNDYDSSDETSRRAADALRSGSITSGSVCSPINAPSASPAADDAASRISVERPCAHNNWDNVRTKKGFAFLRCRTCEAQWKVALGHLRRCKAFAVSASKCPLGAACPLTHVHAKKWTLEERIGSHGTAVMDRAVAQGYSKPDDATHMGDSSVDSSSTFSGRTSPSIAPMSGGSVSTQTLEQTVVRPQMQPTFVLAPQQVMQPVAMVQPGQQTVMVPAAAAVPTMQTVPSMLTTTISKVFGDKMGLLLCGTVIREVVSGSPAAAAGLRGGMIIRAINNVLVHPLNSTEHLVAELGRSWAHAGMVNVGVSFQ